MLSILGLLILDWTHGLWELSVRSSAMYQTGNCAVSSGVRRPAAPATSLTKLLQLRTSSSYVVQVLRRLTMVITT